MKSTPDFINSRIEPADSNDNILEAYNKSSDLFMNITKYSTILTWDDITINYKQNSIYCGFTLVASEYGFHCNGRWYDWNFKYVCHASGCWIDTVLDQGSTWNIHYINNKKVAEVEL